MVVMVVQLVQTRSGQGALEKKVGMLETHQREIHEALLSMENEAARLYQVSHPDVHLKKTSDQ